MKRLKIIEDFNDWFEGTYIHPMYYFMGLFRPFVLFFMVVGTISSTSEPWFSPGQTPIMAWVGFWVILLISFWWGRGICFLLKMKNPIF